jgi:hypothetical protein
LKTEYILILTKQGYGNGNQVQPTYDQPIRAGTGAKTTLAKLIWDNGIVHSLVFVRIVYDTIDTKILQNNLIGGFVGLLGGMCLNQFHKTSC